jgi:cobalamin transport system substrate-binding protein
LSSIPRRLTALTIAGALLVAGCATREQASTNQPPETFESQSEAFPVTVTPSTGDPLTIPKRPSRIVSLSASNTETLFALGAGKQVVAVDDQSDYPPDAPKTDLSGLTPNVEAISTYNPDLVVVSDDADNLVQSMAAVKVPVLVVPAPSTLDDVYAGMELIGKATGHPARDLVEKTRSGLSKVVADTPKSEGLTYYHEVDTTLYSATSKTFIGQVYSLFGLTNIADPADKDKGGYPQLSNEAILQANPDLIFLADVQCCAQNATTVAARPGWDTLNAVKNGNVVELDDDLASRWGPRIVDLAKSIAAAVTKAGTH